CLCLCLTCMARRTEPLQVTQVVVVTRRDVVTVGALAHASRCIMHTSTIITYWSFASTMRTHTHTLAPALPVARQSCLACRALPASRHTHSSTATDVGSCPALNPAEERTR